MQRVKEVGLSRVIEQFDRPAEFVSAVEGRIVERLVKVAERNPKLRKAKIA